MSVDKTVLLEPDLHDGTLSGIVLTAPKTLSLHCADVDQRQYVLRLSGLVRLRANDFMEGNVIFEVKVHTHDFSPGLVKRVYGESGDAVPEWLPATLLKLSRGEWTLLEITSSYGCHLLALAEGSLDVTRQ